MAENGPVCPECGGPVAQTSTFCMHCSADLEDADRVDAEPTGADAADAADVAWDDSPDVADWRDGTPERESEWEGGTGGGAPEEPGDGDDVAAQGDLPSEYRSSGGTTSRRLLPDRFVTKAVTFVLSIVGGLTVGAVSAIVLGPLIPTGWAFLLVVVLWLGSTTVFLRIAPG
ncbi:hypothetical protein L593_02820 [Salinarchaeum sp. Harcht-Bsk1]|uniref:zinc ribbon domain-containing protein n=1 Tax=Salinarchaeum sp. Harcht-Bsk1 TaxID=1333523 RepID=UPI0003423CA4|nr:zinc ribbon domain-containing protein [Salinarchaeum sp. Harcht-Bsk1]AGN00515.1 hypothetical protein L593_02820 [Salinarchaeum sp. Harcht-Bsk1]